VAPGGRASAITAAAAWEAYRAAVAAYNDQVETLLSEVGELITVDPADPVAGLDGARLAGERDLAQALRAALTSRPKPGLALGSLPSAASLVLLPLLLTRRRRKARTVAPWVTPSIGSMARKAALGAGSIPGGRR